MQSGKFHRRAELDLGDAPIALLPERRHVTRVLVVEDHPLMLKAIRDALAAEEWIGVVASAASAAEAMTAADATRPEVVVLDLRLKGSAVPGLVLAKQLLDRIPSAGMVVYSAYVSNALVNELARVGVLGYVSKTEPIEVLVEAVAAVSRGHTFYSSEVRALARAARTPWDEVPHAITAREAEVIQLIADGHKNTEIAELLSVSVSTVNNAVMSALRKLGAQNRAELLIRAIRARLIVVDE